MVFCGLQVSTCFWLKKSAIATPTLLFSAMNLSGGDRRFNEQTILMEQDLRNPNCGENFFNELQLPYSFSATIQGIDT